MTAQGGKQRSVLAALRRAVGRAKTPARRGQAVDARDDALRFITGTNLPPFTFRDAEGRLVGFEIDLAHAVCQELGKDCRLMSRPQGQLFHALQANEGDAIIGLMATDARRAMAAFTNPYMQDQEQFVGPKGFDRPATRAGLRGLKIGVLASTEGESYVRAHFEGSVAVVPMSGMPDLCEALFAGKIDLAFGSIFSLHGFINSPMGKGFQPIDQTMPRVNGVCIAIRNEEPLLLEQLNHALAGLRTDGRLATMRAKWTPFSL